MNYKSKKRSKLNKVVIHTADVHFHFSSNNLIITLSDTNGNTIASSTPGCLGYKNNRRSTSLAMSSAALDIIDKCKKFNVQEVNVKVNGNSRNRNEILKIFGRNIKVISMLDNTVFAFNGTRLRNKRRT